MNCAAIGGIVLLLALLPVLTVGYPVPLAADEAALEAVDAHDGRAVSHATGNTDDEDKRRVATAAVYLLVLVILVGGGLLIAVVMWGRQVRRVVKKPSRRIALGDELWYLKPTKNEATDHPPGGARPPSNGPAEEGPPRPTEPDSQSPAPPSE